MVPTCSGARVPREQAEAVPVSAIINAAASEVEDYTRVVTATVPDSEIVGLVAGDLVHLLAELLDNALRYSPPISQVRVSAVHTGNGGLVIEVSDIGLGMTESDLRVANTRLQSGGEVNPYTARHMGLFVVGRLAQQHGLVVRLRSTIAGEPNSGTTAGVYVPAELIVHAGRHDQYDSLPYGTPADARSGIATALALDEVHEFSEADDDLVGEELYGRAEIPAALLPQRDPGASGISDVAAEVGSPAAEYVEDYVENGDADWPADSITTPFDEPQAWEEHAAPVARETPAPTNTSAFFASRVDATGNGAPPPPPPAPPQKKKKKKAPRPADESPAAARPRPAPDEPTKDTPAEDAIYQKMLSEWLIDPTELANSSDLNWESVWDHGWSAAAAAEEAPVLSHTEHGLPVRDPGVRLVPGAPDIPAGDHNGGAHRSRDIDDEVASAADPDTGAHAVPARDPDAVRASISNHFGGVHAARSHGQDPGGTDNE
jgi:Histidine kinase-, DNA gyrase B-, and HSP90-like ATPase